MSQNNLTPLSIGIHKAISSAQYHADPAAMPSLSSSIAKLLLQRPPYWAWEAHPRLNPDWQQSAPKDALDIGTAAHALLLEDGRGLMPCNFDNWRTKDSQVMRDTARANGLTPLLSCDYQRAQDMATVAREFLAAQGLDLRGADKEVTMIAEVDGVLCRSRDDILFGNTIIDYKTTGLPLDVFAKQAAKFGYDIQAAMYMRIAQELGRKCQWRFLVQETKSPYPVQIFSPTLDFLEVGKSKFLQALEIWRECLKNDAWPGYSQDMQFLDAMPWDLNDLNEEQENNLLNGV